ncbi:hypothetical protein FOA43_003954 [Brettanomyces nanus]|uniref:40S ribosomal protein S27 n=1 Tax=Eeniella nana TaxID=13502 RepID=A0A875SCR4_EENNA|nr:uncharacterized protein FOA43_003954 [Brettanomyces nanus]QPG76564.1 hypothetical protein FOA43_003954 [Brettanomyces nanus]
MVLVQDLLNPDPASEARKYKLKTLVQSPRSYFMDVKCPGCLKITTVFSHAQTPVSCDSCSTVLCTPTGGKCKLTEGCAFRRKIPRVITIAGSDPSGGAGIEADIKTISVLGCYGMTCIDGITIQNTKGVFGKELADFSTIDTIMTSNFDDNEEIDAIKVGMMTGSVVQWFRERYGDCNVKYLVVDPIISSSSGYNLAKQNLIKDAAMHIYSKATLLTPNFREALQIMNILGHDTSKYTSANDLTHYTNLAEDISAATRCRAVLLKGGHMPRIGQSQNNNTICDILYDSSMPKSSQITIYKHSRIIRGKNTHGTGCTLSSAIASYLSLGRNLQDAVKLATCYVHNAMRFADSSLGQGVGPLNHIYDVS